MYITGHYGVCVTLFGYIMLCVSLVLAQLLLIIGMEKTETFARDELLICSVLTTYFLNYMVMKTE